MKQLPDTAHLQNDRAVPAKAKYRVLRLVASDGRRGLLPAARYLMRRLTRDLQFLLPAPSSFLRYGANVMYEAVLELNEFTLKKLDAQESRERMQAGS